MNKIKKKAIAWYKDKKLVIAAILIVLSFILGFYSKAMIIVKFYKPVYLITGLSIWAFSWILLFLGVIMIGWKTVKIIQNRIQHNVKKTVKETYRNAKKFPRKATDYTKKLHKKGIDKIATTSKIIIEKIKHKND